MLDQVLTRFYFFLIFSLILGTPPPSPDSSSHSQAIIKSEFEANTLPTEAKVVRLGNY